MGMCSDGSGSSKVKVKGKEALRKGDQLSKSSMDNAGTLGGMKSSRFIAAVVLKNGASKVKVEGKAWAHHTVPCEHNNGNTVGVHAVPC
jgi:uncharacterized Zn-binding protein involved in type VI secretion